MSVWSFLRNPLNNPHQTKLPNKPDAPRRRLIVKNHARSENQPAYQLKVTLQGIKPPIWRRVLVPSDVRLAQLHDILQGLMGWMNCHMHQFEANRVCYGEPSPDFDFEVIDERKVALDQVLTRPKLSLRYEYDFGDGWMHSVVLERIVKTEPGAILPVCVAGARACPPEDCGGIPGYYNFVEAVTDPSHPEHEEMSEWYGGRFDSEGFDIAHVNKRIGGRRARSARPARM
jgi:hypothetical protein